MLIFVLPLFCLSSRTSPCNCLRSSHTPPTNQPALALFYFPAIHPVMLSPHPRCPMFSRTIVAEVTNTPFAVVSEVWLELTDYPFKDLALFSLLLLFSQTSCACDWPVSGVTPVVMEYLTAHIHCSVMCSTVVPVLRTLLQPTPTPASSPVSSMLAWPH